MVPCPVCGQPVPETQIELHVNECLERMTDEAVPQTPGGTAKPAEDIRFNVCQWAELNKFELDAILHQPTEDCDLEELECALQSFIQRIREARPDAFA